MYICRSASEEIIIRDYAKKRSCFISDSPAGRGRGMNVESSDEKKNDTYGNLTTLGTNFAVIRNGADFYIQSRIFIDSIEFSTRNSYSQAEPSPSRVSSPSFAFFGRLPFSEGASISIFPFSSFCVRPSGRWRFQSVAISITSIVILFVFVSFRFVQALQWQIAKKWHMSPLRFFTAFDGKFYTTFARSLFNDDGTFFFAPDRPFSNSKFTPRSDAAAARATGAAASHHTFSSTLLRYTHIHVHQCCHIFFCILDFEQI